MDYERLFLEQLGTIEQIVRFLGRRHRLTPDELEELSSSVRMKLLENDFEAFRKFQGRSSLRTYLSAVIGRHFLDARIAKWGKWRPCVQARRIGPVAVLLDRLVNRDGYSFVEAVEVLRTNHQSPLTEGELAAITAQLPIRSRRRFVDSETLAELAAPPAPAGFAAERKAEEERVETSLAAALNALPSEDRLILKMRFQQGLQVAEIARLNRLDQKLLYRRIETLMRQLRKDLQARGVLPEQVATLLENEVEVALPWGDPAAGTPPPGPSTS